MSDGGGLRFNKDKLDPNYCPSALILAVAAVFQRNSESHGGKYPDNNWRRGMDWSKPINCHDRHWIKFKDGLDLDEENLLLHLAEAAANIAMLIEYTITYPQGDDRYKKASQVFEVIQNMYLNSLETVKKKNENEKE